jgi:hypothetical protein
MRQGPVLLGRNRFEIGYVSAMVLLVFVFAWTERPQTQIPRINHPDKIAGQEIRPLEEVPSVSQGHCAVHQRLPARAQRVAVVDLGENKL